MFKNKTEVINLINRTDNISDTRKLTEKFANLKEERKAFYLSKSEFDNILRWKLRSQYDRQKKNIAKNTSHNIETITKAAFGVLHDDFEFETKLRLKILTSLSGVEIPVASAILTLCFPQKYSVIDFRNWRRIFPEKISEQKQKTNYTLNEYITYLNEITILANRLGVTPQQVDIAIWQLDIENKS